MLKIRSKRKKALIITAAAPQMFNYSKAGREARRICPDSS
jgi:hypothetical protein